jgi:hypothetical protein
METLFGAEMPLAVRFFIAFLIVLGLIGATAWAVRRFGSGRLGHAGARGRQPRLAVIDSAPVDGRRRLVLIRRDNVEHLLMIGGPSDIVVEPNIVRAVAAPRDLPTVRPPAPSEALPRAMPLPETGSWPLQPESAPVPPPRLPQRPVAPADDAGSWPLQPQAESPPPPRLPRDPLAGLADELGARPVAPREHPPREHAPREHLPPREHAAPRVHAPEPRVPAPPAAETPAGPPDQSLAEMAHRLEAALRKPSAAAPAAPAEAQPRAAARPAEPKAPRSSEPKPAPAKNLYDSLEQEMASLLGRPAGKT